jgi:hypothetical protein
MQGICRIGDCRKNKNKERITDTYEKKRRWSSIASQGRGYMKKTKTRRKKQKKNQKKTPRMVSKKTDQKIKKKHVFDSSYESSTPLLRHA